MTKFERRRRLKLLQGHLACFLRSNVNWSHRRLKLRRLWLKQTRSQPQFERWGRILGEGQRTNSGAGGPWPHGYVAELKLSIELLLDSARLTSPVHFLRTKHRDADNERSYEVCTNMVLCTLS